MEAIQLVLGIVVAIVALLIAIAPLLIYAEVRAIRRALEKQSLRDVQIANIYRVLRSIAGLPN